MLRRLLGDLPEWVQPDHPLLRYELSRKRRDSRSFARIVQVLGWLIIWVALVGAGYLIATNGLMTAAGESLPLAVWNTLFFPLLGLQLLLRIAGLSLGISAIGDERRRQTWDPMRATEYGAALTLRTRWAALLFYHLRGLLALVFLTRFFLLAALLYELLSMRGGLLSILIMGSEPSVSWPVSVVLLAATLTGSFLMPITATGVDVALGLWIAATLRQRTWAAIVQILIILARVAVFGFLLFGALQFLSGDLTLGPVLTGLLLGAWSVFGDWGVTLLQLSQAGEIWSQVPFSIFYGVLLVLMTIVQVGIASGLLTLAIRNAERRE